MPYTPPAVPLEIALETKIELLDQEIATGRSSIWLMETRIKAWRRAGESREQINALVKELEKYIRLVEIYEEDRAALTAEQPAE